MHFSWNILRFLRPWASAFGAGRYMPDSYCNASYASWFWHFTTCRHCHSFSRVVYDDARLIAVAHYNDERAKFHIHIYADSCGQRTCLNRFKGQTQDWSHLNPGAISSYAQLWASDKNVASQIPLHMLLHLRSLPKHTLTTSHRELSYKSFLRTASISDDIERHEILLPISTILQCLCLSISAIYQVV